MGDDPPEHDVFDVARALLVNGLDPGEAYHLENGYRIVMDPNSGAHFQVLDDDEEAIVDVLAVDGWDSARRLEAIIRLGLAFHEREAGEEPDVDEDPLLGRAFT